MVVALLRSMTMPAFFVSSTSSTHVSLSLIGDHEVHDGDGKGTPVPCNLSYEVSTTALLEAGIDALVRSGCWCALAH